MGTPHPQMFFHKKRLQLTKLASEPVILEDLYDITVVTLDKNEQKLPVGLTIGNMPDGDGVLVISVLENSLASLSGIRPGAVIITVNEHPVGTHAEAVSLMGRSGKGIVTLGVARNSF